MFPGTYPVSLFSLIRIYMEHLNPYLRVTKPKKEMFLIELVKIVPELRLEVTVKGEHF